MTQESTPSLPTDALDRFTVVELAQILALSRFSRRPVKQLLHAKGVPDNAAHVEAFLGAIARHPQATRILELADIIDMPLRFHATPHTHDQSTSPTAK